eukprot:1394454-Alexandrium_andersonii.AAC.1
MGDVDIGDIADFEAPAGGEPRALRGPSIRTATGPRAGGSCFMTTLRGQSRPPILLLPPAQRRVVSWNPG